MILKSDRLLVFIQNENYEHYLEETVKVLDKIAKFVIQDAKIIEYTYREDLTRDKFQCTVSDAQVTVKTCGLQEIMGSLF